jgi:hypothetical protein
MPGPAQSIAPVLTDNDSVEELNPEGGGVTNQLPSLKVQGEITRQQNTTFNVYKNLNGQKYDAQHPNAQHTGDDYGRGEITPGGGVGTLIDEQRKNALLYSSGNKYKPGTAGSNYYNFTFGEQYW